MVKWLLFFIFIFSTLSADQSMVASQPCEATNNLKGSNNQGNITLLPSRSYTILEKRGENVSLLVPEATPKLRWAKRNCFNESSSNLATKTLSQPQSTPHNPKQQSLLALSWHDAFCETHRNRTECALGKGSKEQTFVLHGLWPQPKNNAYCNLESKIIGMDKNHQYSKLPDVGLSPKTAQELLEAMPGARSGLEKHEWAKHGSCSGMSSENYFSLSASYTRQFNASPLNTFISSKRGQTVSLKEIRTVADQAFGNSSGERIEMVCHEGLLSELRLSLGNYDPSLAKALSNGAKINSTCRSAVIDKAGW